MPGYTGIDCETGEWEGGVGQGGVEGCGEDVSRRVLELGVWEEEIWCGERSRMEEGGCGEGGGEGQGDWR